MPSRRTSCGSERLSHREDDVGRLVRLFLESLQTLQQLFELRVITADRFLVDLVHDDFMSCSKVKQRAISEIDENARVVRNPARKV